ncbi:MAG: hypothetical protein MUF84_17500, partial [Anaerolineae bacterium]|nr:hypothetical protein [Anaerolineae bacterium]
TFTDAIRWDSLRSGYPAAASDLPVQRIAPLVNINPGYATQLSPGEQVKLVVTITNPDILPYSSHRMTVTLGSASQPLLAFASLNSGAVCVSCPPDGREWVVAVNVGAEETQAVTFTVKALTPTGVGVFTAPVTATLAYQGLPNAPQPPATTSYAIDRSVAQVGFTVSGTTIFARPGLVKLPIFTNVGSGILTCKQQVSINRGGGWEALGALGAVSSISATLPSGYNALWQLQVVAPNGLTSTISVTVQADDTAPAAQVPPRPILTRAASILRGTATDNSGRLRAVEVSVNRGPFRRAILLGDGSVQLFTAQGVAQQTAAIDWAFPVQAGGADGEALEVVVRAIDAAGNVGASTPVTVTLDTVGPAIIITESLESAGGTATDGSGVAQVQISLDGGLTYQVAVLAGENWSFDYDTWSGGAPVGFVTVRAVDVHGNATQAVAPATPSVVPADNRVYLPLVTR